MNVYIRRIKIISSAGDAGGGLVAQMTAQLQFAASTTFINKFAGGGAPKGVACGENNATLNHFASIGGTFDALPLTAATLFVYEPKGPLVAPPGTGWGVWNQTANTPQTAVYEWDEH